MLEEGGWMVSVV